MSFPPTTLTIALGFAGTLRIVYPNGKSIDLPQGDAEARLIEVLEGYRRELSQIRRSLRPALPESPQVLSLEDLDL